MNKHAFARSIYAHSQICICKRIIATSCLSASAYLCTSISPFICSGVLGQEELNTMNIIVNTLWISLNSAFKLPNQAPGTTFICSFDHLRPLGLKKKRVPRERSKQRYSTARTFITFQWSRNCLVWWTEWKESAYRVSSSNALFYSLLFCCSVLETLIFSNFLCPFAYLRLRKGIHRVFTSVGIVVKAFLLVSMYLSVAYLVTG